MSAERDYKLQFSLAPLFLFGVAIFLNFQNLILHSIQLYFGLQFLWMIIPALLFIRYIPTIISSAYREPLSFLAVLFLFILFMHSMIQFYRYGIYGAVYAFSAYGLWLGLYAWCLRANPKHVLALASAIFIASGILHASLVMYEYYTDSILVKLSNIGAINRYYGISTSLSVMGLQIAVGILALAHHIFEVRRTWLRILLAAIATYMIIALFISSSRGPMYYLIISSSLVLLAYIRSKKTWVFVIPAVLVALVSAAAIHNFYALRSDSADFFMQALSVSDESNQKRFSVYTEGVSLFSQYFWVPIFGYGSGDLTQVAAHLGNGELTLESSLMKGFLELGILGMTPFMLSLSFLIYRLYRRWRDPFVYQKLFYFSILLLILLQCTTHETYKTWIGSFYLALSFGTCSSILITKRVKNRITQPV